MAEGRIVGAWSWRRAVIDSDLNATQKHVLLTLATHVPEAGDSCFPRLSTLARETSRSRDVVKRALRSVEGTWIARQPREDGSGRQTSNLYVLLAPGASTPPSPADAPLGGCAHAPDGEGAHAPPTTLKSSEEKLRGEEQTLLLTEPPSPNGKRPDPDGDYTAAFEELWRVPLDAGKRPGGKRAAFKAYLKAVPKKVSHAHVLGCLRSYVHGLERDFNGANLSTWLNQAYWEQETPMKAVPTGPRFT